MSGELGQCLLGRKRPGRLCTAERPACAKDSRQDNIVGLLSRDERGASLNAKPARSDGHGMWAGLLHGDGYGTRRLLL